MLSPSGSRGSADAFHLSRRAQIIEQMSDNGPAGLSGVWLSRVGGLLMTMRADDRWGSPSCASTRSAPYHRSMPPDRLEDVALLALLRLRPEGASWAKIANEVQLEGSAVEVLDGLRDREQALLADPGMDAAVNQADADLAEWEATGLDFISILSDRYPTRLAGVFDAPPFLFASGTVVSDDRGMSVVGSRKMSAGGEAMARDAARILAERGLTVIAGLAEGIDKVAHQTALELGARTVAVIGTGIRKYYPAANRQLQDEIAAKGLVISQFYPDAPPSRSSFPMRNGTMSGYGMATIVIEAGEHSGTRIQARRAAEHGRPVVLSRRVAEGTEWGGEIAKNPWVYVVASRLDIERAVDGSRSDPSALLLRDLGLVG